MVTLSYVTCLEPRAHTIHSQYSHGRTAHKSTWKMAVSLGIWPTKVKQKLVKCPETITVSGHNSYRNHQLISFMPTWTPHSPIKDQHHILQLNRCSTNPRAMVLRRSSLITKPLLQPSTMSARHANGFNWKQNQTIIRSTYRTTMKHIHRDWLCSQVIPNSQGPGWIAADDEALPFSWRCPFLPGEDDRVSPGGSLDVNQRGQVSGSTSRRKKLEEAKWKFNYPTSLYEEWNTVGYYF